MKRNILTIFLSIFILSSCDSVEERPDCSMVLCAFDGKSIRIKYVDKTTNNPLFGTGASYTVDKLKVIKSIESSYTPTVKLDSNDPTVVIVTPVLGTGGLTLGNLATDIMTVEARSRGKQCCAGNEVISLKINGETICAPCDDFEGMVAVVKK